MEGRAGYRLAVTMGDPSGIGPELLAKAAAGRAAGIVAVGDLGVFERAARIVKRAVAFEPVSLERLASAEPFEPDVVPVIDLANVSDGDFAFGELRAEYGRAAYESLVEAIDLARLGVVSGVVTNPINKEALHLAGVRHAGHTEILAEQTGTKEYAMMLVHGEVRVVHVSTHVSLRVACDRVRKERVLRVIELTREALLRTGVARARIAVAGLNPHAGEHGLFGSEDRDEIAPAVEEARRAGIDAVGPLPPDTLFPRLAGGAFDAAVVMYHDQGHIPVKLLGFRASPSGEFGSVEGVNVTLGLPIIRTSVDHGTAFDLAGTGRASEASLVSAIEYARLLSRGDYTR